MTQKTRTSSVEQAIDENLKRAYNDVASEPLPSRFTDLLNQLKSGDAQGDKSGNSDEKDD
ncbi:MAG: NepR family anti-sigma factor [Pseudomonadota bacterium]